MIFYIMGYYSFSQLLKHKKTIFQYFNTFFKVNEIRPIVNSSIEKDNIGDRSILWIDQDCGSVNIMHGSKMWIGWIG